MDFTSSGPVKMQQGNSRPFAGRNFPQKPDPNLRLITEEIDHR